MFLNTANDCYVALDAIGRRIWELLCKPKRIADLAAELSDEFEATRDVIAIDVLAFLKDLEREGMVRVIDQPSP